MTFRPTIAAFFDVDYTVLNASSSVMYVQYMRRHGRLGRRDMLRVGWYVLLYRTAIVDFGRVIAQVARAAAGESESETRAFCDRWFREVVVHHVSEDARRRIAHHRAQGHRPVLLSAATQYVNRPLAGHLDLGDDFLCTRLETQDGVLTGRLIEPACYGAGKLYWAGQFAAEQGIDLAASYFYTDSYSDLPVLRAVGHPVAVNPDARLLRHARRADWPILTFG
jgi:HAD superfamily hydrolase (TIGR01490 family)